MQQVDEMNLGISAHTDFEAFTMMFQDAGGLQLQSSDSKEEWIDAPPEPFPKFTVILGDALERFTNGKLRCDFSKSRATPHRVLCRPHPRFSLIRFNGMDGDVLLRPFPQFVSEANPNKYEVRSQDEHLEAELSLGYANLEAMREMERGTI
eukprot:scaffold910_cov396-Prasinococcus_capsulatus_cf.AAC.48